MSASDYLKPAQCASQQQTPGAKLSMERRFSIFLQIGPFAGDSVEKPCCPAAFRLIFFEKAGRWQG